MDRVDWMKGERETPVALPTRKEIPAAHKGIAGGWPEAIAAAKDAQQESAHKSRSLSLPQDRPLRTIGIRARASASAGSRRRDRRARATRCRCERRVAERVREFQPKRCGILGRPPPPSSWRVSDALRSTRRRTVTKVDGVCGHSKNRAKPESETSMELKAGLVGCGAMSRAWLQAAAKIPDLRVVALADLDTARARSRAAEFSLNDAVIASDVNGLIAASHPDLLFDVVVPSARHDVVSAGLASGAHVLSEKPMAESLADAQDLVERAKAAGRIHAVVQIGATLLECGGSPGRCAQALSVRSPAFTPTSSLRPTSAGSAKRWTTFCCSTWRSTASTRCAA